MTISSTVRPQHLIATVWPPIGLAEPGLTLTASTPPPMASLRPRSAGLIPSTARSCGETGSVRSLVSWPAQPSDSSARPAWACASMKPGSTHLPVTSTISAPAGTVNPGPSTAAIFPSRSRTVPPSTGSPSIGTTWPPVIAIVCATLLLRTPEPMSALSRKIIRRHLTNGDGPTDRNALRTRDREEVRQQRSDHLRRHRVVVPGDHRQPGAGDGGGGGLHRTPEPLRALLPAEHERGH